jgi:uncharacterized damage-inducible protein DinB
MAFYGGKDLEAAFRTVRKNTIAIAEDIPEDKYGFRLAPGVMSVGEMLAHIALAPRWQIKAHGQRMRSLDHAFFGANAATAKGDEQALKSKSDILKALRDGGDDFGSFLGGLSDDILEERVALPSNPAGKTRFEMLLSSKEHEMHHRGQLMLIERQLGIVPHLTRQREAMIAAAQAATR